MYFKYEFTVRDLALTPAGEYYARDYPLLFDYGRVCVELRPPLESDPAGYDAWTTLGEALGEYTMPESLTPMFDSLARGELPEASAADENASYFDSDLRQLRENYIPPAEIMPAPFPEFSSRINRELMDYAMRTVRVLRVSPRR